MSDKAQVALVNMPFSYSKYPSIQLGTLSALLKSQGIPVDCHHLNVRFAHKIGVPLYEMICEKRALFGEWIFSYLLFRDNPKRAEYPQPVQAGVRASRQGERASGLILRRHGDENGATILDLGADRHRLGAVQDCRLHLHVRSKRREPDDGEAHQGSLSRRHHRLRWSELRRRDGAGVLPGLSLHRSCRGRRRRRGVPGVGSLPPGGKGGDAFPAA